MNKVIKDLENILNIHGLAKQYIDINYKDFVVIDPKQVAEYLYGIGYRKVKSEKEAK